MAEYMNPSGYTSTAGNGNGSGVFMVHTPVWCSVVRGFQIFFGLIIMVLAGILMHGLVMGAVAFGLVCGLFTLIIVTYALVSEKAPKCRQAYNIWALLALDLFMAILWLSSMGANAALRASFVYDVDASCYDDGSTFNSGYCVVSKRDANLTKRYAVATKAGLAQMVAIAGLSALEMLLFIATLVHNGHAFRMHHQASKAHGGSGDISQMEMKGQQQTATPVYVDQQQYPSQVYPQQYAQPAQVPHDPTYYDKQPQATTYAAPVHHEQAYAYPQQTHTPDPYQQQQTHTPGPYQQQQAYDPPSH